MAHVAVWNDPSSLFFRRTRRQCPEGATSLVRIVDKQTPLGVEMCNDAHGILVEEEAFRLIGESVPMPLTAQMAVALPGDEIFNPRHHNHLALGHMLAHRLFKHKTSLQSELAKLPT